MSDNWLLDALNFEPKWKKIRKPKRGGAPDSAGAASVYWERTPEFISAFKTPPPWIYDQKEAGQLLSHMGKPEEFMSQLLRWLLEAKNADGSRRFEAFRDGFTRLWGIDPSVTFVAELPGGENNSDRYDLAAQNEAGKLVCIIENKMGAGFQPLQLDRYSGETACLGLLTQYNVGDDPQVSRLVAGRQNENVTFRQHNWKEIYDMLPCIGDGEIVRIIRAVMERFKLNIPFAEVDIENIPRRRQELYHSVMDIISEAAEPYELEVDARRSGENEKGLINFIIHKKGAAGISSDGKSFFAYDVEIHILLDGVTMNGSCKDFLSLEAALYSADTGFDKRLTIGPWKLVDENKRWKYFRRIAGDSIDKKREDEFLRTRGSAFIKDVLKDFNAAVS